MDESGGQRILTVAWEDPQVSRRDADAISGLDYLIAIREGRIKQPPAARLIGYSVREVQRGRAVFELKIAEQLFNPFATVHGGILCTLLDSAMTAAVLSTLRIGLTCSTLEIKVNFVRPVTGTLGVVRGEGNVIHLGSSFATAEGKVLDGQGKLYAHGVGTCSIRAPAERRPPVAGSVPGSADA